MTARISQALVEIPSAEAISSTRVLTDCGSRRLMRATGSSSASEVADSPLRPRSPGSDSGISKVGSASAVWIDTTNSGSLADHPQLNRRRS